MFVWWLIRALFPRRRGRYYQIRPGRPFPVQVLSVQDGDSLIVCPANSRRREEFRFRLYAIDAPEWDQEYGREARDYLNRLVWKRTDLVLEPTDTDRYGRLVGVLFYRAVGRRKSVNRLMVEQGLARWYSQYGGHGLGLEQAERDAQRRRRGVWSSQGQVAPWEHRQAQRREARSTAPQGWWRWLLLAAAVGAAVAFVVVQLERSA